MPQSCEGVNLPAVKGANALYAKRLWAVGARPGSGTNRLKDLGSHLTS